MNTHTYTAELAAPQTKYADSGKPMSVCIIVNGIDVRHDCEGGRLAVVTQAVEHLLPFHMKIRRVREWGKRKLDN